MQTIELSGLTFRWDIEPDDISGAPWDNEDGHGIVSEWTQRSKRPGERVLCEDGRSKRFYDVAETMKIAKRDGWDAAPYGGTPGERAARAVDRDFEYLRGWCNGDWEYVGVVVTLLDDEGEPTGETDSLWGIESSDAEYIQSTAQELAQGIADSVIGETSEVSYWACRDVITTSQPGA